MGRSDEYRSPQQKLRDEANLIVEKAVRRGIALDIEQTVAILLRDNPDAAIGAGALAEFLLQRFNRLKAQ